MHLPADARRPTTAWVLAAVIAMLLGCTVNLPPMPERSTSAALNGT